MHVLFTHTYITCRNRLKVPLSLRVEFDENGVFFAAPTVGGLWAVPLPPVTSLPVEWEPLI